MNLYDRLHKSHRQKALKKMGLPSDTLDYKPPGKWEDFKAKRAVRESIRESRPWWLVAYDSVDRFLFGWNGLLNHKLNPGEIRKRVRAYRQRAKRGWADRDVWSTDSYISKVLSEMLAHLAENNVAWPGEGSPWKSPDDWSTHLRDLSTRLGAWHTDDGFSDTAAYNTTDAAMEEFGKNLGYYWD